MITLLSTIFGVISSLLPNIVKIFEKRIEYKYELELTKIRLDAAREGLVMQTQIEAIKADTAEGESVRRHDRNIEYTGFWAALRASIRPTITYLFFALFCGIKIAAFSIMADSGASPTELLLLVWDTETMAIFSAIIGFWFGSRAIEKFGGGKDTFFSLGSNRGTSTGVVAKTSAVTAQAAKTVSNPVPAKKPTRR